MSNAVPVKTSNLDLIKRIGINIPLICGNMTQIKIQSAKLKGQNQNLKFKSPRFKILTFEM